MHYYSLHKNAPVVSFRDATLQGQAPDKGLYFPERIPLLPKGFLNILNDLSKEEIATTVLKPYIGNSIPDNVLQQIVSQTFDFPFPLQQLDENIFSLELFHGPTLAFKDVGARFMSRCMGYFLQDNSRKATVLVATSGDTGGAVANGFYNVPEVQVIILYPAGKVSPVQELQLTTLGENIQALQVQGNFDDCQQLVKKAFADEYLKQHLFLTSANSINVARWLPQQLYYFFAQQQWPYKSVAPLASVPSGNFGNIAAGILAKKSGLPISHFIAACNNNDVVTKYLDQGNYLPKPAISTLSNAMDVGDPSNFIRIQELIGWDRTEMQKEISSFSISDKETVITIQKAFETFEYMTDPHGAVALAALQLYLKKNKEGKGYFLETAHPVKFPEVVEKAINEKITIPDNIDRLMNKEKIYIKMENDYEALRSFLMGQA